MSRRPQAVEQGHHYLVMEYVEGEPLDRILKRQNVLPWDRALEITIQVARGLKHAHEHGIVHRDIKPANIFICKAQGPERECRRAEPVDGAHGSDNDPLAPGFIAKILDLGLSKSTSADDQSFYTQTGVVLGTPHYISPEGPTVGVTVHTVVVLPSGPRFTACDCAEPQRILKSLIADYRGRDVEVLITSRTLKSGRRAGRASGAVDVRDVPGRDGAQRWPTVSR